MTAITPHRRHLTDAVVTSQTRATDAAAGISGSLLDAVTWTSAHLAAVERTVHPAIRAALPDGKDRVRRQQAAAHILKQLLRFTERSLAGDMQIAIDPNLVRVDLLGLLREYTARERDLIARLEDALPPQRVQQIADAYRKALAVGPTRPHPHLPSGGLLAGPAYRFSRIRDHALDTMDGRVRPWPLVPPQRKPVGRWGLWLLGTADPLAVPADTDSPERRAAG